MESLLATNELFPVLIVIVMLVWTFFSNLTWQALSPSHRPKLYYIYGHLYFQGCLVTPIAIMNKIRGLLVRNTGKKDFQQAVSSNVCHNYFCRIIFLSLVCIVHIRNFLSKQNNKGIIKNKSVGNNSLFYNILCTMYHLYIPFKWHSDVINTDW